VAQSDRVGGRQLCILLLPIRLTKRVGRKIFFYSEEGGSGRESAGRDFFASWCVCALSSNSFYRPAVRCALKFHRHTV
jgi:hypothetical protein